MNEALLASVEAAVAELPEDLEIRVHLAELLLTYGRESDAVRQAATALLIDPDAACARAAMSRALAAVDVPAVAA